MVHELVCRGTSALRCPYCHVSLAGAEPKKGCDSCLAWHHAECWDEHGRCSTCGSGSADQAPVGSWTCARVGCPAAAERVSIGKISYKSVLLRPGGNLADIVRCPAGIGELILKHARSPFYSSQAYLIPDFHCVVKLYPCIPSEKQGWTYVHPCYKFHQQSA